MPAQRLAAAAAFLIALAPPALAAPATALPGRAAVLKDLSACRAITDPAARLDCYDRASAALDQAEASGEVVVVDRAQARAAHRQAFGFNLNALNVLDRALTNEEINSVTATASAVYRGGDGRWVIELNDGARWRQIDDADLYPPPHQGSKIRVRRASLGSYMMNIDGQPSIRVHRDE